LADSVLPGAQIDTMEYFSRANCYILRADRDRKMVEGKLRGTGIYPTKALADTGATPAGRQRLPK